MSDSLMYIPIEGPAPGSSGTAEEAAMDPWPGPAPGPWP